MSGVVDFLGWPSARRRRFRTVSSVVRSIFAVARGCDRSSQTTRTGSRSLSSLFAGNPAEPGAWRATIARVQAAPRDRALVAGVLADQLERRGAPPEARQAAETLVAPSSVAIVTGQQAGAFGGPLYTVLKAVTAIQLARRVQSEHNVPVVPVFWVDSEDHDWEEIRTATTLDADFNVAEATLPTPAGAGSHPVGALVLDDERPAGGGGVRRHAAGHRVHSGGGGLPSTALPTRSHNRRSVRRMD